MNVMLHTGKSGRNKAGSGETDDESSKTENRQLGVEVGELEGIDKI